MTIKDNYEWACDVAIEIVDRAVNEEGTSRMEIFGILGTIQYALYSAMSSTDIKKISSPGDA